MKYILIILVLLILLTACQSVLQAGTVETRQSVETIVEIRTVKEYLQVEDTTKTDELQSQNSQLQLELKSYRALLDNLNELLSNVYYGYASNDNYIQDGFTAFSLEYNNKYYIITAGHCVENENGKFSNFKFKANFSDKWIYAKLLTYENDFIYGKDYAVFYSDKINSGLKVGGYELPAFILGNGKLNIIKKNTDKSLEGESGSPVVNINSEVIGIMTGSVTNIIYVLQAIDNIDK